MRRSYPQYSPWELSVYKRVYRHKTCNYSHIRRTRQTMASWSAAITRFLIRAVGDQSATIFRLKNTSTTQVYLVRAVFSLASWFRVTGTSLDRCIATNTSEDFTVAFSPQKHGAGFELAADRVQSLSERQRLSG